MKSIFKIAHAFCMLLFLYNTSFAQQRVSGTVYDKSTKTSLPGASIYVPDLKTGVSSDASGNFTITNLPKGKFLFQVTYIGYKPVSRYIETTSTEASIFELEATSVEAREIVITGSPVATDNDRNSVHVDLMERKEILQLPAGNIIDAIAHTPGVSQITSGGAVSKPVIRGLGFNRIVTLHDGVRQEGQQWGEEHGIEIDKFAAEKVEILRGPSSLIYGSDAMGGVINIIEPIPAELGTFKGGFDSQFADNGPYLGNSLMLEGNHKGFHARARASYVRAGDIETPNSTLENTSYREKNFTSNLGVNKRWGYTHLNISSYDAHIGFYDPFEDHHSHKIPYTFAGGETSHDEPEEDGIKLPFQKVDHQRLISSSRFILGKNQLEVNAGAQFNNRREFHDDINTTGLNMALQTYHADLKFHFAENKGWEKVIGISGMTQKNENKGHEYLIPDYDLLDAGAFIYIKKTIKNIAINSGIRIDNRQLNSNLLTETDQLNVDTIFDALTKDFTAATGALGLAWKLNEDWLLRANLGRGFRAPNLSELKSNGIHEGTKQYEIGDDRLQAETSLQSDLGISYTHDKINADISLFSNTINNFIYSRNIGNEFYVDGSDTLAVYRYVSGKARLSGLEFSADMHFTKALHLENSLSFVYAENLSNNTALPYIPPVLIHNEIKYEFSAENIKWLDEPFISFGVDNHLAQNRVDINETKSVGYSLINAGLGTTFKIKQQAVSLTISGKNLANVQYADHLNRLRNIGAYNPGRILFVSLNVPFDIKKN